MDPAPALPPSLLDLTTYLLAQTGRRARARLAERLAERELRLWHYSILTALADFGPHVQRELAERLGIDPSDIVRLLDELSRAGLVERARSAADRRRIQVSLTPVGLAALTELRGIAAAVQDEVLAPLGATEREQLHGMLLRVHAAQR
ncbi:MarR family winged helix-turn-helix transcriptional regulator [Kitasatospora sp. NBC_01287]|uniref:MarR family winged helix-turn-helix transcriptional regulator n=1 Tax=Kitasatospora sp. NBC_01287 TaxID=2903573 RepID=UPI002253C736|nr:MarR family winged helix-turn-helix transcriptional regulator [Kitasatospora sp. NBC_01287]MCX4748833.1 MarR family winged helix-turn-helix transcriptional regulator [Kitasatospora sp. NBC_01287]